MKKGILLALLLIPSLLLTGFGTVQESDDELLKGLLDSITYSSGYEDYLSKHAAVFPDTQVVIDGKDCESVTPGFYLTKDGLYTLEEGSVTYSVNVPKAGYYNIEITYYPVSGKNNSIERMLSINGEIPFENAQYIKLSRRWTNETEIKRDSRDNDVRPRQCEAADWITAYL